MNPIESIENGPFKGHIHLDPDPVNPREDDNAAVLWCWHRKYNMGDLGNRPSTPMFDRADIETHVAEQGGKVSAILPVFLLDHSGLAVRTTPFGDQWDSGQIGWAFLTEQAAIDAGLEPTAEGFDEQARALIENEVSTYNSYVMGEVYGYTLEGPTEIDESGIWGYYGLQAVREGLTQALSDHVAELTVEPPHDGRTGARLKL